MHDEPPLGWTISRPDGDAVRCLNLSLFPAASPFLMELLSPHPQMIGDWTLRLTPFGLVGKALSWLICHEPRQDHRVSHHARWHAGSFRTGWIKTLLSREFRSNVLQTYDNRILHKISKRAFRPDLMRQKQQTHGEPEGNMKAARPRP